MKEESYEGPPIYQSINSYHPKMANRTITYVSLVAWCNREVAKQDPRFTALKNTQMKKCYSQPLVCN